MQTFHYVQASEFALSPRSLLPLRVFPQGSRDLLRPGISCFVTSARSGYAIRPIQVIDGKRTFTFQDLQPCRLLQCRELAGRDREFFDAGGIVAIPEVRVI